MLKEFTILKVFFEDPYRVYSAREIAKIVDSNHVTVSKSLQKIDYIERKENGPFLGFKAILNDEFLRLRFIYNYQKLFDSGMIDYIKKEYDEPIIILFGSYLTATNTKDSDIDILIISDIKEMKSFQKYEKYFGKEVQIFLYTSSELKNMKKTNPELLNSFCNGLVLSGELEVF